MYHISEIITFLGAQSMSDFVCKWIPGKFLEGNAHFCTLRFWYFQIREFAIPVALEMPPNTNIVRTWLEQHRKPSTVELKPRGRDWKRCSDDVKWKIPSKTRNSQAVVPLKWSFQQSASSVHLNIVKFHRSWEPFTSETPVSGCSGLNSKRALLPWSVQKAARSVQKATEVYKRQQKCTEGNRSV